MREIFESNRDFASSDPMFRRGLWRSIESRAPSLRRKPGRPLAGVCGDIRLLWRKAAANLYTRPDVNDGAIGLRDYDNKVFIAEYGEEEV